jgi:Tol biopolymer transport system component
VGAGARYVPTGHLVYAVGDGLYGRAFDLDTLTVAGTAVPLGLSVRRSGSNLMYGAEYNYALSSESGTLVHVAEEPRQSVLVWVDRDGREEEVAPVPGQYVYLRLSPDGGRVLIEDRRSRYNEDLLVWGLSPPTRTRLIPAETRLNRYPEWTPDGRRIVYHSGDGVVSSLAADGSAAPEVLLSGADKPYFFSPDGRQLVFRRSGAVGVIPVEPGGEAATLFAEAPGSALNAELSPNHRWMAYQSDQSGQFEVYVRPFPNVDDARVQVSTSGGVRPLWSPDGRELLYVEAPAPLAAGRMMSAVVNPDGTTFSAEAPRFLLDWPYPFRTVMRTHDVSPDGQRFLAIKTIVPDAGATPGQHIVVIQHWTEELKRLVRND